MMVMKLSCFLESGDLLSDRPFAYRLGRSTVGAVREFCTFVSVAMADNRIVEVVFCDLTKAYHCVT